MPRQIHGRVGNSELFHICHFLSNGMRATGPSRNGEWTALWKVGPTALNPTSSRRFELGIAGAMRRPWILLRAIARRDFGAGAEDLVVNAWSHFSAAIRLDPDTGPTVGGNNAVADPFFFDQPHAKTFTLEHSFRHPKIWSENSFINPYWPYVFRGFIDGYVLYPDFTNQINVAEEYAKPLSLPVFHKYLLLAADEMERGLENYRKAALAAPTSKRHHAFRMVLLAEQIERMLRSNAAMLEFENLRFHLAKTDDVTSRGQLLKQMVAILKEEIPRTQAALATAERDSCLGYEWEEDYLYSPYTIRKKLEALRKTLEIEIPAYRKRQGIPA